MGSQIFHEIECGRRSIASRAAAGMSRTSFHPLAALIVAVVLLGLSAPASADDAARLEGAWECDEDGTRSVLEFMSSGELSYNGVTTTYELAGETILVEEEYGVVPYLYGLEGDSLVIVTPDGWVLWCRKSAQPLPSTAVPDPESGTDGLALGILVPGPDWPAYELPMEPSSADAPSAQALLYKFAGRWDHVTANAVTNLYLHPDGTYESDYEVGYSGQFEDQGGYQTGGWGATGAEQGRGTSPRRLRSPPAL
jgi:hypothetical protein